MSKKLDDLYEKKESLHKGLFSRGYSKVYNWVDKNLPHNHLSQPKPKKVEEPNLGQKDVEKPKKGIDWGQAAAAGWLGGSVGGFPGSVAAGYLAAKLSKKK